MHSGTPPHSLLYIHISHLHSHIHTHPLTRHHPHKHPHELTGIHAATQSHAFACTYICAHILTCPPILTDTYNPPCTHTNSHTCILTHTFTTVCVHTCTFTPTTRINAPLYLCIQTPPDTDTHTLTHQCSWVPATLTPATTLL